MDDDHDQALAALHHQATSSGQITHGRLKRMIDIDNLTYVSAGIITFVLVMPALYSTIVDKYWREHKADKKMEKESEVFK